MSWGKTVLLVTLTVAGSLGFVVVGQLNRLIEKDATAAVLRKELATMRQAIEQLSVQSRTNSFDLLKAVQDQRLASDGRLAVATGEIGHLQGEVARQAEEKQKAEKERDRADYNERALVGERQKTTRLQEDLRLAQDEIESLKEQGRASTATMLAMQAAQDETKDQAVKLAEEGQKVGGLSRELQLARQEMERLKAQSTAALEEANSRARERAAALSRDLRAARKELQRRTERSEVSEVPGG
jgi:hypothetical protein